MTHAAVGIRCPECAGRRTAAQRAGFTLPRTPYVTYALIAANIALFVLTNKIGASGGLGFGGGTLNSLGIRLVLFGPAVAHGQDYRLLSAAFIHYGILHIAVNMYALYLLGGVFERYAGPLRFAAVYFTVRPRGELRRADPVPRTRPPPARRARSSASWAPSSCSSASAGWRCCRARSAA